MSAANVAGLTIYIVEQGRIRSRECLSATKQGYWVKSDVGPIYVSKHKSFNGPYGGVEFNTKHAVFDEMQAKSIALDQITGYKQQVSDHLARIAGLEAAL